MFNCFTHGEYCPESKQELITKGPFVVWPVGTKQERDKLKRQTSKRTISSISFLGAAISLAGKK